MKELTKAELLEFVKKSNIEGLSEENTVKEIKSAIATWKQATDKKKEAAKPKETPKPKAKAKPKGVAKSEFAQSQFPVVLERRQFDNTEIDDDGRSLKVSKPFTNYYDERRWLKFLWAGKRLNYTLIDVSKVPKGLPKSYKEFAELEAKNKKKK